MRLSKFGVLSFTALSLMAFQAQAAVDAAGAAALKTKIAQKITAQQKVKTARGDKLNFTGDVQVTPKETYYAVLLPNLKLAGSKGETVNVGQVALNMVPVDEAAGQYKTSISLPSTMNYQDAAGQPTGKLSLGAQKASGLFDVNLFSFTQLNASYATATYEDLKNQMQVALNTVAVTYDMTKNGAVYSGPISINTGPASLVSGGNTITIADKIDAKGTAQITAGAQNSFTQTSTANITGIANAISALNSRLASPDEPNKALLQKTLGGLSIIQLAGKPVGSDMNTRSYTVVTNANGKTLINGVDVSLLIGGGLR